MPTDHRTKRPRIETTTKSTPRYSSGTQIKSALRTDNPDKLTQVLSSIRNQLSLKAQEITITPHDERLIIVRQWVELSPEAQDLFEIWDKAHPGQSSAIALVISCISAILTLLSAHYADQTLGHPIMKHLLTPVKLRYLNSYIGGSHNEIIIVTLKLYNVMSTFASGKDKNSVMERFGWDIKSLPKLLNMRRRTHGTQDRSDALLRPDIRTLFILFLLSFFDADASPQTKSTFFEQHRDIFLSSFKGIGQDHYSLARRVLEACWTGIWSDNKLKRTVKIGLFNENTVGHLIKLYDQARSDDEDEEHVPANLVHHFLLAICTRPGIGICFKDRGWYPREADQNNATATGDEDTKKRTGRIFNKMLANVLRTLKVNEDSRQQELATKILVACPELVAGYWSAAALTLEPRLSTTWITNISFVGNIVSLPVPTVTFYLPNQQYNPTPPPLSTIIESILPTTNSKTNLSKGLQSPSGLVQHCTALMLSKCLIKYQSVLETFRKISEALEEDEDGQWSRRCKELEREVRRRVPDFMVVVAFGQQTQAQTAAVNRQVNQTRTALLVESAQRLLWLYQRCLPAVVAEARFDVGRSLQAFVHASDKRIVEGEMESDSATRLYRVQQLHVLSLLRDSDQFAWSVKLGQLPHTPLVILLQALASSTILAVRKALGHLLCQILSRSVLFQEDPHEPDLWLKALPAYRAPSPAKLPSDQDTLDMQDESEVVITFLDDCIQKCLRTPYKYLEALSSLSSESVSSGTLAYSKRLDQYPSPLLMTLLEQLEAKTDGLSRMPAHIFGITAFIGKLIFRLLGKVGDLRMLKVYVNRVGRALANSFLGENEQQARVTKVAVERELEIMQRLLTFDTRIDVETTFEAEAAQLWLTEVEKLALPETVDQVVQVVDKLRTLQAPLTADQLARVFTIVSASDHSVLPTLIEHLVPGKTDLWGAIHLTVDFSRLQPHFSFERLYLHTRLEQLYNEEKQTILVDTIFTCTPPTPLELSWVVRFLVHGLTAAREEEEILKIHILLLTRIFEKAKLALCAEDFEAFKEAVFLNFLNSNDLKMLFLSPIPKAALEATQKLLEASASLLVSSDRKILSDISNHWFCLVKSSLHNLDQESVATACVWIKYLEPAQLLDLLDCLHSGGAIKGTRQEITMVALHGLATLTLSECQTELDLARRLPLLLSLRSPQNSFLLDRIIASAIETSFPMALDGSSLPSWTGDFSVWIKCSTRRWADQFATTKANIDIDFQQFLNRDQLSDCTVRIINMLLYKRPATRAAVARWITSEDCSGIDIRLLLPVIHALCDVSFSVGLTLPVVDTDRWLPLLSQLTALIANEDAPRSLRLQSQSCLAGIFRAAGNDRSPFFDVLSAEVKALKTRAPTTELITLAIWLKEQFGSDVNELLSPLVEIGMQWSISHLADEIDGAEFQAFVQALALLVKVTPVSKVYLVETLLSVIIQYRLSNTAALQLAISSLLHGLLKPVVVNRQLQNIVQHQQFFKLCSSQSLDETRTMLIKLLHFLFNLHPNNTCQITHMEPLIRVYRGTVSTSDIHILSIFQLFEKQRKLSVTPLLSLWSATANTGSVTALEALQTLDPTNVFRTCLHFPRWRRIERQVSANEKVENPTLYDPVFLLLLFNGMIAEQPPSSVFDWVGIFRTNVVSLFLRALSAKDGQMRELAFCQIVALWRRLEDADFQEKPHVQYMLNLVKQLMPNPSSLSDEQSQYPRRLSTYTTLHLSHALRAIFYPTSFLYPLSSRFLLQRPVLDDSDVPMLYAMLYSSSDENWKKERTWIIKFLADGMVGSEDWKVFKRRHTWDLLASLFQSESDVGLRAGILEVLANLTCNAQATMSLILKSGLLPWIEMQLLNSCSVHNQDAHGVEWIKILENILIIVNHEKIDNATNGDWRRIISRCLCRLLDGTFSNTTENFPRTVPVILRLTSLKGMGVVDFSTLLSLAVAGLEKLEAQIRPVEFDGLIHEPIAFESVLEPTEQLSSWGNLVEMLWHSCMLLEKKSEAWDALTPRILMWRSLKGGLRDDTDISEWARREVVTNMRILAEGETP